MSERIQKVLAAAGVGSRRGIEEWLRAGRLAVNGQVAKLGDRASPEDVFTLDGQPLQIAAAPRIEAGADDQAVLIYHKPLGEVSTRADPQGRPTVFERLPPPPSGRWVNIGRLDVNTTGLLLFTNDGELAHRLMHPSFEVERRYQVRLWGEADAGLPDRLCRGLMLDDGPARFLEVIPQGLSDGHSLYVVSLKEGRNREVRRLFEAAGYEVSRLKRVSYGPFELPEDLGAGKTRQVSGPALAGLLGKLKLARNLR